MSDLLLLSVQLHQENRDKYNLVPRDISAHPHLRFTLTPVHHLVSFKTVVSIVPLTESNTCVISRDNASFLFGHHVINFACSKYGPLWSENDGALITSRLSTDILVN